MSDKQICPNCNERPIAARGKCQRCYQREYARAKKQASMALISTAPDTPAVIEPEVVTALPRPLVHLVARNPSEMQAAQSSLGEWLTAKLKSVDDDIADLDAAIQEARSNNWSVSALTRQRSRAIGYYQFYSKLKDAVEAGYTIIPDFPVELFAIRVDRSEPNEGTVYGSYGYPNPNDEQANVLATGEGEYVNPVPQTVRYQSSHQVGDEKKTRYNTSPTSFREVLFPLRACRPEVMNATAEAMALKVFDQIGICPPKRKPDPLIIGQILGPLVNGRRKCASFIIGWYLNMNDL